MTAIAYSLYKLTKHKNWHGPSRRIKLMATKPIWKPHTEQGKPNAKDRKELLDSVFAFRPTILSD
jgi:hypothetical protein